MTDRLFGIRSSARATLAFALAASFAMSATAQQADTPTTPPIDFRLPPPTDDGRSPGVQGPADNGIAPSGPGDRRGPTPAPTPAPMPTAPRVIPTQPVTQPAQQPAARTPAQPTTAPRSATASPAATVPAPDATDTAPAPSTGDAAPGFSPSEAETPALDDSVPAAASDTALVSATPADDGGTPIWMWLLALLAAGGAGYWYWRRRPALAVEVPVERNAPPPAPAAPPRPARVPAASAAAPVPAPRAAPVPAPLPRMPAALALPESAAGNGAQRVPATLVNRPVEERRAVVGLALEVLAIRMTPEHVTVGFALNLVNQGTADATGLMVRIALNQGSAMTEPVLARFFDGAGGSVLRDDMVLKVGAGEALTTEASLPRHILEPLMIGGKPMLVPVMAFDVTYHWEGDADAFGQVAGSFVLGRESGSGESDKLAPLPLDRASYTVDRPGSRSTAVRRSQ